MHYFHYILDQLLTFNGFIFILNLVIFIFSKQIIEYMDTSDMEGEKLTDYQIDMIKRKRKFLIIINSLIFVGYIVSLFFKLEFVNKFVIVLAIILFAFLVGSLLIRGIVTIYGEKIEINGETYIKKGYKKKNKGFYQT